MMTPILEIPESVSQYLKYYRNLFCRKEGFESICRFVTGLLLSPNKTLQGIHACQVFSENPKSRRSMHESVFESGWSSEELMSRHRNHLSSHYSQAKGKSVISLDWTFGHHDWGKKIHGVKWQWDYVKGRYCLCQSLATATISNPSRFDPIDLDVQEPKYLSQEKSYLDASVKESYSNEEEAKTRLLELLHYSLHEKEYKTIHELFIETVHRIEKETYFPGSDYAFDNGVLQLQLTQAIESYGKHWVSELEIARNIMWKGKWTRIDLVDQELKEEHPEAFQVKRVKLRTGEHKDYWVFSKVVRLKKGWGRKRIAIVHEKEDLSDRPRFLITDANHWDGTKMIQVWSYRWPCEVVHDFGKNILGLEQAQVRKKEAVLKHLRLSCVSQSILNQTEVKPSTTEQFSFAQGQSTVGQKVKAIAREALHSILEYTKNALLQQRTTNEILDQLMPV